METVQFNPTPKQALAYLKLKDNQVREIGYGGGAGGGKSYIGCFWVFEMCLNYPKVRYLIGRKELTNLKRTTLATFFKVIADLGLQPNDYFKLNSQTNTINFHNGSQIILMDMARQPSDPDYLRFGGLELTGYFLDESNEIEYKAIQILKSRIGRQMNKEYSLLPKQFETFNPSKNHVYTRFYQPYRDKQQTKETIFIMALATDNTYLDDNYIKTLERLDEVTKQRLLYGNFDYDDDDRALVKFNKILDCFTNSYLKQDYENDKSYITADLAMAGRDNFVVTHWKGLWCRFRVIKQQTTGKEIEETLKQECEHTRTPRSNVVFDYDGMGNYLESYFEGAVPFKNGSSAIDKETYKNLKSECAFKLAEKINEGLLYIDVSEDTLVTIKGSQKRLRDVIVEELSQLKRDNIDKDDQKLKIISKEEMKENIGRSPDILDTLLFRMYFEVQPSFEVDVLDEFNF